MMWQMVISGSKEYARHFISYLIFYLPVLVMNRLFSWANLTSRIIVGDGVYWRLPVEIFLVLLVMVVTSSFAIAVYHSNVTGDYRFRHDFVAFTSFKRFGIILIYGILKGLATIFGVIALIIPGIWINTKFAFADMIYGKTIQNKILISPTAILAESYRDTHGHFWGVFIIQAIFTVTEFAYGFGMSFFTSFLFKVSLSLYEQWQGPSLVIGLLLDLILAPWMQVILTKYYLSIDAKN